MSENSILGPFSDPLGRSVDAADSRREMNTCTGEMEDRNKHETGFIVDVNLVAKLKLYSD